MLAATTCKARATYFARRPFLGTHLLARMMSYELRATSQQSIYSLQRAITTQGCDLQDLSSEACGKGGSWGEEGQHRNTGQIMCQISDSAINVPRCVPPNFHRCGIAPAVLRAPVTMVVSQISISKTLRWFLSSLQMNGILVVSPESVSQRWLDYTPRQGGH